MTGQYKRWYDHDPLLLEVIELLRNYQDELREQAQVFLDKIEAQVGKEIIDNYFKNITHIKGNRWYDHDPVLSRTIELLRIVPPEIQKAAAQNFLSAVNEMGLNTEVLNQE